MGVPEGFGHGDEGEGSLVGIVAGQDFKVGVVVVEIQQSGAVDRTDIEQMVLCCLEKAQ